MGRKYKDWKVKKTLATKSAVFYTYDIPGTIKGLWTRMWKCFEFNLNSSAGGLKTQLKKRHSMNRTQS